METGAYITEISNLYDRPPETETPVPKFTRFTPSDGRSTAKTSQCLRKTRCGGRLNNRNFGSFAPEEYYSSKKVKPGMSFYKIILQIEERRKSQPSLPILSINIPETVFLVENTMQMLYSQNKVVKVNSEINYVDFMKIIEKNKKNRIYPSVLTAVGNGCLTDFSIFLSNQLDSRIPPKNQNQYACRYVAPFGECPNLLRLFYVPKNIKNYKPNFALKCINKRKLDEDLVERKYKQLHNYVVDLKKQQHVITTIVKGKALSQVEAMSQSIIDYLQAVKNVKISEIVVDYVLGEDKVYYLHEIKSIKSSLLNSVWDIGSTEQLQQKYKEQTNQTMCRLCGFFFSRLEMKKIVTNKLIVQLIAHLKGRGISAFQNNLSKCTTMWGSSNVCQLCYEIIVAEHTLIDIQQQFHSLMNVSSDEVVRVRELAIEKGNHNSINKFVPYFNDAAQMTQWRMFFYVQNVKNMEIDEYQQDECFILSMKFNDVKENFMKQVSHQNIFMYSRARSACLKSVKSFNSINRNEKKSTMYTNATNRSNQIFHKENVISFEKVKLLTFYTKNDDISHLLANQDIKFQLLYKNHKYKGESSTLQNFSNKKECQRHSCQVLLFNQKFQYCNLQLNVGIVCDGKVDTSSLHLKKSQNGAIFLSEQKLSCSPLPAEWIQTISEGMPPLISTKPKKLKSLARVQSGCQLNKSIFMNKWRQNIVENDENDDEEYL